MGVRINKDNIYLVVPTWRFDNDLNIHSFMENDFTVYIKAKIYKENLSKNGESFLFSRNGRHAGISVVLGELDQIFVNFTYWFEDNVFKQVTYMIPKRYENNFNEFIVISNQFKNSLNFYINGMPVGEINYQGLKRHNYSDSFIWLGAGSMIVNDDHQCIGDFEVENVFFGDISLKIDDILDIADNYKEKYLDYNTEYDLPLLNNLTPYKEHIKLFTDFNYINKFKAWNMVDNPNNFQIYLKNNIYF